MVPPCSSLPPSFYLSAFVPGTLHMDLVSFSLSSPDGAKAPIGELHLLPCCPPLPRTLSSPSQVLGKHLRIKGPLPLGEASRGLWLTHFSQWLATVWLPKALKVNVLVDQTAHCMDICSDRVQCSCTIYYVPLPCTKLFVVHVSVTKRTRPHLL